MSQIIIYKDQNYLNNQKIAGRCINNIFKNLDDFLKENNITLKDIENLCLQVMKSYDCSSAFLNYDPRNTGKPFPSAICCSVNNTLVHGICTDYKLNKGDKITVDIGTVYNKAIADAARTWIYKSDNHSELLSICKTALQKGIEQVKLGNRIGSIGNAISKYVKQNSSYSIITLYGGHGLGLYPEVHTAPFVANFDNSNNGIRIQDRLTIAIEPMISVGSPKTLPPDKEDGWTVRMADGNMCCHFEDTVTLFEGQLHRITGS